jgi:phosphatidylinositol glycan class A protein
MAKTYNIAMVCDFFYPQPGGVESHIYQLSTKLIDRGHKVIVISHAYEGRTGVRYLTNGLKVYHVPFFVIYRAASFPTVFSFFPIFRNIVLRERIDIVHGHQSLSTLCAEAILHGRTMGLRTVFTDHSLFGFADASSILTNKLLKFTLSDVDHVVCVSHTCKENTVLRASLDPLMVSVIPNALVADSFRPLSHPSAESNHTGFGHNPPPAHHLGPHDVITIVVVSRLFYNKGTDLLTAAIPRILEAHPNTRFIIAGSGPKAIDLEQMIEQNVLQDRVEMLGPVRHEEVRDVMVRGHIYLHPSLTEAFGTVIVEAASCGLYVVCTQVGGIPEVLPSHMTVFARPEEDDLVAATGKAIAALRANRVRTERFHDQVKTMYSWTNVAQRTERVYRGISGDISEAEFYCNEGAPNTSSWSATRGRSGVQSFALIDRLKRYYGCGIWAGKLFCLCVIVDYLLFLLLELVFPRERIDICPDWPRKEPEERKSGLKEMR